MEGNIIVDDIYKDETLWLSQKKYVKSLRCCCISISKHSKNTFEENKKDKNSVISKMKITSPME